MLAIHGHTFDLVFDADGVEHVTLKALCEPFGLKVQGQTDRLVDAAWARVQKICTRRSDGKKQAFACLRLDDVPMFFATLSPGHVKPEVREALIIMQREAAGALASYYRHGGAVRPDATLEQLERLNAHIESIIRPVPLTDTIWPDNFVRKYALWHGYRWTPGDRHPFSMKGANSFFYRMIFPEEVLVVIKAQGLKMGARYHQVITDGPRDYLQRQLEIVTAIALDCQSEAQWRRRVAKLYGKSAADLIGQQEIFL